MSSTVVKDGHTFTIHVMDPKSEEEMRASKEPNENQGPVRLAHSKIPKDSLALNCERKTRNYNKFLL